MNNDKKIILHPVTNEEQNSFVGLRIRNDVIKFYYPESYELGEIINFCSYNNGEYSFCFSNVNDIEVKKTLRNDLIGIIRTISLAKSKSSKNNGDNSGVAKNDQFAIMSYLWTIRDYQTNGYYRESEKVYTLNGKGKVNWKRTLKTQPIISNGNVIYNNIVVEVRNDCDDVITEAHRWCVFDSVRKIGWLFGLNEKSVFVPRTPSSVIKKYIRAIKTELGRTFDDMKKLRLNHMLRILNGVDDTDRTKEIVYGVDKYHYVYERMVDYVFSNVMDITKYNPNAKWYLKRNQYDPKDASPLRPDTIRLEPVRENTVGPEKVAYVLDAKYYRFGTTGNENDLPTTTSIQKQITYGDNIICNLRERENIQQVYNAFILPYNKENNKFGYNKDLEYIGFSEANWRHDKLAHVRICAFLMDTKHLISVWSQGNCSNDIKELIKGIEEAVNYKK